MHNTIDTYSSNFSRQGNITKIGNKSFWLAFCLTFPAVAKIVLPSSLESLLEIQLAGVPLFLPNLLLFVFFANTGKNHGDWGLKAIFWLQFLFMMAGFFYNHYVHQPLAFLLAGNFYYYILFLGLYSRINNQERIWIGRIFSITMFFLGGQVILLGLGVIKGFGAMVVADEVQQYGDFYRVGTTAGASTGTAVHLYMLTAISVMLSNSTKWRYFLFVFGFSATLLTMSRGSALAFFMYLFFWLYYKTRERRNRRKLRIIVGSIAALFMLYFAGVFNPLIERMESKVQNEDMFESREDRAETALMYYQRADSKLLGVGITNIFRSTEIRHLGYENVAAPHNSYIQTLCEQGIIGFVLLIQFWLLLIIKVHKNKPILFSILPLLLVIWNTESSVVVLSDFMVSLSILLMLSLDKDRKNELNLI